MPNRRFNLPHTNKGGAKNMPAGPDPKLPPTKTANWTGVPNTQPRDRSQGVKKLRQGAKEEGL